MTDAEQDILTRWKKRSNTLQAGADESGDDSTRFSRCRPGYYRGDGLADRENGTRVAVRIAGVQAGLGGNRSCWQRERGRTREGLNPAIGAALSVALVGVGSLTPDPGQALAQCGPVPGVLLLDLVRQEPGRLPQIQWVDH